MEHKVDAEIEAMLRELGRVRRAELDSADAAIQARLVAIQRRIRKRQATHLLNAAGYLIVVAAVVIVLLSL